MKGVCRRDKVSWNEARRGGVFQIYGQDRCVKLGGVRCLGTRPRELASFSSMIRRYILRKVSVDGVRGLGGEAKRGRRLFSSWRFALLFIFLPTTGHGMVTDGSVGTGSSFISFSIV